GTARSRPSTATWRPNRLVNPALETAEVMPPPPPPGSRAEPRRRILGGIGQALGRDRPDEQPPVVGEEHRDQPALHQPPAAPGSTDPWQLGEQRAEVEAARPAVAPLVARGAGCRHAGHHD